MPDKPPRGVECERGEHPIGLSILVCLREAREREELAVMEGDALQVLLTDHAAQEGPRLGNSIQGRDPDLGMLRIGAAIIGEVGAAIYADRPAEVLPTGSGLRERGCLALLENPEGGNRA